MTSDILTLIVIGTALACTLSVSADLDGARILVPLLALTVGPKESVALAALLLAANNLVKVVADPEPGHLGPALIGQLDEVVRENPGSSPGR